ncbi:histidine kinase [Croceitalea sp. MTPC9]|uniref:sensor histidine kinase n=1 Tax=unclassified Croceitalea TaxID=2632280 RepID=UPI002B3851FE|nr:histidine kinase [Croceitalea sp. MTPC6]GMN15715.1 histidine kinase [Croceitalea sp. MTPC9]
MEWNYKTIIYQPTVQKHVTIFLTGFFLGILLYTFLRFNESQTTLEFILSGVLGILISYSVHFSNSKLNTLISFKKLPGIRILFGVIWDLVLSFLIVTIGFWAYSNIMNHEFSFQSQSNLFIKISILLFCAAILYNVIYFALYSYNHYAKVQVKELKLERKQAELQLSTLKSQLRPHFLFNSINVLTSLFHKDVILAEQFIRALAKSYEYTLENYRATLVTVEEEVHFAEAYLLLLQTRFGKCFRVNFNLDEETLQTFIPPLTLQLLVENASKHNSFNAQEPLTVSLYKEGDNLVVSNPKTEIKTNIKSTKLGLKNISARYAILIGKKITIEDSDNFTIKLPIINK